MTDEVRDYAAGHENWPAGDLVRRLRATTQALGDLLSQPPSLGATRAGLSRSTEPLLSAPRVTATAALAGLAGTASAVSRPRTAAKPSPRNHSLICGLTTPPSFVTRAPDIAREVFVPSAS